MAWLGFVFVALMAFVPVKVVCKCEPFYTVVLTENQPAGQVFTFKDVDQIKFKSPTAKFDIVNKTLELKKDLILDNNTKICEDWESNNQEITFRCTSSSQGTVDGVLAVNLRLTDDFPPQFTNDSFIAHITEGNKGNVKVVEFTDGLSVTDKDCGTDVYSYNIEPSDDAKYFTMTGGTVYTNSTIDYETQHEYHLNIKVLTRVSGASSGKTATTNLTVFVDDVDDRDPVFSSTTFKLVAPEETNLTSKWLETTPAIQASDGDKGINTPIVYSLANPTPAGLDIEINPSSGQIKIKSILDREKVSTYQIEVKAAQKGDPGKFTLAQLTLQVQDVNDHLPQFSPLTKDITLREDVRKGKLVMLMNVTDEDIGDNANNSLSVATDDLSAFGLENYGKVTWLVVKGKGEKPLLGKSSGLVQIHATSTTPIFGDLSCDYISTCVMNITVTILDVNDHSPKFDQNQYDFVFQAETGNTVGIVTATDEDKGNNAKITYTLDDSSAPSFCQDIFGIDNQSGEITKKNEIQQSGSCPLLVKACDNPTNGDDKLCSPVPVEVEVEYIKSTYDVSISENLPNGTLVMELPISNLELDSTDFKIESNRLVTSKPLDRESAPNYKLLLKRTKSGDTVSTINVHVLDVNDNPPVPENKIYNISLTGLEPDGKVIANVKATDKDEGKNGEVNYSFFKQINWLSIDKKTGIVKFLKMPSEQRLQVYVDIYDNGHPPLKSLAVLQISDNTTHLNTSLVLPLPRKQVILRKEEIERKLSRIIGLNISVVSVRAVADLDQFGSELFVRAFHKDRTEVQPGELKSIIKENAQKIYDEFHEEDEDEGLSLFKILFIAAVCLFVLMIIILIIACRYYRTKDKKKKRELSIMRTMKKDTKLYDSTLIEEDFNSVENGGASVSRSNGISTDRNVSDFDFVNPAYSHNDDDDVDDDVNDDKNSDDTKDMNGHENVLDGVESGEREGSGVDENETQNNTEMVHLDSPAVNSGDGSNNWTFDTADPLKDSQEVGNISDSTNEENSPRIPFISTIKIEKPMISSEIAYTNTSIPDNLSDSNSNGYDESKPQDLDSGFPSDKDGQDEEEPDKSPKIKRQRSGSDSSDKLKLYDYESITRLGDNVNEMPNEPEPDYAKKVRFNHSDDQKKDNHSYENVHTDEEMKPVLNGVPPDTFYFLDQTVTAL